MLPPDTLILTNTPFFFYDHCKSYDSAPMRDVHYHNYYEIYYLVSGNCNFFIGDKIYSISNGSLLLIPPQIVHKTVYLSSFHERILLNFNNLLFDELLMSQLKSIQLCKLKNDTSSDQSLFYKLSKMAKFEQSNIKKMVLLKCYLNELIIYILNHHLESVLDIAKASSPIESIIEYISANYQFDIRLKDLSELLCYTPDHISKLFKKASGTTFKEYLLLTRLSAAENMLLTTNQSIKEIAYSCGFNDSNYFTHMFSKKYGMPPLKYKKTNNTV